MLKVTIDYKNENHKDTQNRGSMQIVFHFE